jgi:hypothetical protein
VSPNGANDTHAGSASFEKEKGTRLVACDRPFLSSNELQ